MNPLTRPATTGQWTLPHEGVAAGHTADGRLVVDLAGIGPVPVRVGRPLPAITVEEASLHTHPLAAADIPDGTVCLVVFADGRHDRGWLVATA